MKKQLLVVDDEAEIRRMLERHFRVLGYAVVTASQGAEALEILAQRRVDVVISDIMMPVMDGVSLLREIRRQYPMIRVIMITGQVTLENALACMRNQADTCIFKPLTELAQLEQAVEHAFQGLERWNQIFRELQGMSAAGEGHVS